MGRTSHIIKVTIFATAVMVSGIASFGDAHAQFLNRQYHQLWEREEYENYASISYRDYDPKREQRTFDPFGIYLIDGVEIFRLEEYRSIAPFSGSALYKSSLFHDLFQNLTIVGDNYANWSSKITIGSAVEARFTPLTLSVTRFNGIRWDSATRRNRFTIVGSRVSDPVISAGQSSRDFASYLYGGRWEGTLGDVVTFGASYVNVHSTDNLLERGDSSYKGMVPNNLEPPNTLYVIVYDDSPEDGFGARVYGMEIYVDGIPRPDLIPEIRKVYGVAQNRNLELDDIYHIRKYGPWLSETTPLDLFIKLIGRSPIVAVGEEGFLEASGSDVLVYKYEVPADAGSVEFSSLVSHDYSIDIASALGMRGVVSQITWDDWHNVRRSPGKCQDGSNIRWEEFGYGLNTGLVSYGADVRVNFLDFDLRAEYVRNLDYSRYPTFDGKLSRGQHDAYFMTVKRPVTGPWEAGVEIFRMPETFASGFTYWRYDINRFDVFNMVDDNDDLDQWPDSWEHWDPFDPQYKLGSVNQPTPEASRNLSPQPAEAVGFGVFPGLDEDRDGIPDVNVNNNKVPDYLEPFLMYYVDPEDFVFGDDFNNDGIVDARENDNLPDYPYELDSRGQHVFVSYHPQDNLTLTFGRYDVSQIAGGGQNYTTYTRLLYKRGWPQWGTINLNYIGKRVQDDIPFSSYQFIVDPRVRGNFSVQVRIDPLEMRNSFVNTFFARARFTFIPNLNMDNSFRYDINDQLRKTFEGGAEQGRRTKRSWALISRFDYLWRWRSFDILPMFKYMAQKITSTDANLALGQNYTVIPILRLDYRASPRTTVRAGVQGLPFLKHIFRSKTTPFNDFDAEHYIFMIQNRSNYAGYDISFSMGYEASLYDYVGPISRTLSSRRSSEVFIQMLIE